MNHRIKETTIKYIAGLYDADGSLSFQFKNGYVGLQFRLGQSDVVDKDGKAIKGLQRETKLGKVYNQEHSSWKNSMNIWVISSLPELERLLPRIAKHSLIKARHIEWMLNQRRDTRGKKLSEEEITNLKEGSKLVRQNAGPLKPKNHVTWAWLAGFMDGDGWYSYTGKSLRIGAASDVKDRYACDLIAKSLGSKVVHREDKGMVQWRMGMGPSNASRASKILPRLLRYARIKDYKIEMMIHTLRQRLSKSNPTG